MITVVSEMLARSVGVKQCPEANCLNLQKNSTVVQFLCLLLYFDSNLSFRGQNAPIRDKIACKFNLRAILSWNRGSSSLNIAVSL